MHENQNDKFIVLDETKEFYHVKLESNNSIAGYIERDLINSRRAVISSNGQMFVNPDFTSEAVCEVFKGDVVLILSEINEYYHVKLGADRTISGYIGKDLLAPPQETKKPAAEIPAATSAVTTDAFYNATSNKTNYYTNNLSTPYRRVVNRPGLLSFVGYTFAVIGWIGIVCGVIGLLVAIVAGCQASQYGNTIQDIAVGIPAVIGGVILLGGSIFASAGMGVLKGGQVARVFAILLSLLFIPTILFTILFLIGLLNHDASDYFDYCNK
jgi:hypothetical protein